MTILPSPATLFSFIFLLAHSLVHGLGSASTLAVTSTSATVCGIVSSEPNQRIICFQNNRTISVLPNTSYQAISGGGNFFCALRSGGSSLLCWDTLPSNSTFRPKRIYHSKTVPLADLTVGEDHVCATRIDSGSAICWRGIDKDGSPFPSPDQALEFRTISSGNGFTCGILKSNYRISCWGNHGNGIRAQIQRQIGNLSMSTLVAGESHVCGLTLTGNLVCAGSNDSGQSNAPSGSYNFQFSGLALGANFSCAIKQTSGFVTCWGLGQANGNIWSEVVKNISFESVVAGSDFACGLMTVNLSVICWGPGWSNSSRNVPIGTILPGPCVLGPCGSCGTYSDSGTLCNGSGNICKSCRTELPLAIPLPPTVSPSPAKARNKLLLAFLIVGSVGAFAGICSIIYCLWRSRVFRTNHQTNVGAIDNDDSITEALPSRTSSIRRSIQSQRNWSAADRTQKFCLSELAAATNDFSPENKIGGGSFGVVYKGKLQDGREVAVKRGDTTSKRLKKLQEKESAFESEIALLSRVHHKHLVGLVGYCDENDEKLLVYEYMANGALYHHLHNVNVRKSSNIVIDSWKTRIQIALDAARGIEYLHSYAVPPIIHRDIKSSNILLDANWTARVSDFGLSLLDPDPDVEYLSTATAGTFGYIDPEYYVLNILTTKSDVYGFGVVLLELLTGKKAVFRDDEESGGPVGVVEYARPWISGGKLRRVLDKKVRLPEMEEVEAVELVATTALWCVKSEGRERPSVTDIVSNLERAVILCEGSQGR